MTRGTLSRGTTKVTFEVWRDSAGQPALARDIGRPEQKLHEVSGINPQVRDDWTVIEQWTVLGMLKGENAYSRADRLVEDLVKPHSTGTPLQLDLTSIEGVAKIVEVGVPSENAVELDYVIGAKNRVDMRMSLPVVSETVG